MLPYIFYKTLNKTCINEKTRLKIHIGKEVDKYFYADR